MPTTNQMISRSHVRQGRATISESAEMAPSGATSHTAGVLKGRGRLGSRDRKSTRLNSSHSQIPYAVFALKKKKVVLRARLRDPHQETTSTATKVNLDRTLLGEDLPPVQRVEPIGRFVDGALHYYSRIR